MAKEIVADYTSGDTLHFFVRNVSGYIWQTTTSAFVEYEEANKANYDTAMPEIFKSGSSGGSCYMGDFPTGITAGGRYFIQVFDSGDVERFYGWIWWTGTEEDFIPRRLRIR